MLFDNLPDLIDRAIALLRDHEPPEGYYLAFSGGKDSCVIKELAKLSGARFESHYHNTTIDPPELVKFIKQHHADVVWDNPPENMLHAISTRTITAPTRKARWCCEDWKERNTRGSTVIIGVRAAESPRRARAWSEVAKGRFNDDVICPIVYWSSQDVWRFIKERGLPYCSLYDEGFKRLGCVGCPVASVKSRLEQFQRWPRYYELWRRAVMSNWEKTKDVPRKDGKERFAAKFQTAEEFWEAYLHETDPDYLREECQSGLLFTNEEDEGVPSE
jgi:phosphoadenosine phosphosulfate reductase